MALPLATRPRQLQRRSARGVLVLGLVSISALAACGLLGGVSPAQVADPDSGPGKGEKAALKETKKDAKKVAQQKKVDSEEVAKIMAGEVRANKKKRNLREEEKAEKDHHKHHKKADGGGGTPRMVFIGGALVLAGLVFACKRQANHGDPSIVLPPNQSAPDETPHQEEVIVRKEVIRVHETIHHKLVPGHPSGNADSS